MTSNTIDMSTLNSLIAPIANSELPIGDNLRLDISPDCTYQVLRNERSNARNSERQALSNGDTSYFSTSEWEKILELTPGFIANESKDLEVVAWYIEALTRFYGFKGLAYGFSLAKQLIENFGESLHPQPDEDGISTQLAPLTGLNGVGGDGALIIPIKSLTMTEGESTTPLSCWQCEQVFEVERISDNQKREARIRQGALSRDQLDQVMRETSTKFIHSLQDDIALAIHEFEQYQQVLDTYSHADPQPTGNIMKALKSCHQVLVYIAGDRLKQAKETTATIEDTIVETPTTETPSSPQLSSSIDNREQALETLRLAASFFKTTEPHSPISYAIEQAIRWSRMPLTELIQELIPDDDSRKKYQHLSGIPPDDNQN